MSVSIWSGALWSAFWRKNGKYIFRIRNYHNFDLFVKKIVVILAWHGLDLMCNVSAKFVTKYRGIWICSFYRFVINNSSFAAGERPVHFAVPPITISNISFIFGCMRAPHNCTQPIGGSGIVICVAYSHLLRSGLVCLSPLSHSEFMLGGIYYAKRTQTHATYSPVAAAVLIFAACSGDCAFNPNRSPFLLPIFTMQQTRFKRQQEQSKENAHVHVQIKTSRARINSASCVRAIQFYTHTMPCYICNIYHIHNIYVCSDMLRVRVRWEMQLT